MLDVIFTTILHSEFSRQAQSLSRSVGRSVGRSVNASWPACNSADQCITGLDEDEIKCRQM